MATELASGTQRRMASDRDMSFDFVVTSPYYWLLRLSEPFSRHRRLHGKLPERSG
jgi:DNA modification methylase